MDGSSWVSQRVVVLLASVRAGSACRCRRFLDGKLHINNKIFVHARHRHDRWYMDAPRWPGEGRGQERRGWLGRSLPRWVWCVSFRASTSIGLGISLSSTCTLPSPSIQLQPNLSCFRNKSHSLHILTISVELWSTTDCGP